MSAPRAFLCAASLTTCVIGLALVTQGASVPVAARMAQVELNRAFEHGRPVVTPAADGKGRSKPATATAALALSSQRQALAAPTGSPLGSPVARIEVKRLGVREVVLMGAADHSLLDRGPVVVKAPDAANPVTVLAAHRDTHFLFIRDLREGDRVTVEHSDGTADLYRVTHFETVRWDAFTYPLDPPRPLLALATCYPFGGTEYGGPWRRVAWAEKVP